MCGFAGIFALRGAPPELALVHRMTDTLRHRGPDDEGYYAGGNVAFGFRRLSILDLSPAGHQPMESADGGAVIVFNGEIYNYVELRTELEALGHRFRSHGDTEVLLAAYDQWGTDCLARLSGMWAFLIHDRRRGRLFGARDRFGMKPLYMRREPDRILFGSEIKSLLAACEANPPVNWRIAADFLVAGRLDESEQTFFEDIRQLGAARAFTVTTAGRWDEWTYWHLPADATAEPENAPQQLLERFETSVKRHLRSDVPLAIHFSGGLDSTSILSAVARQRTGDTPIAAFTFVSEDHDESAYLDEAIAGTRVSLVEVAPSPEEMWDKLPGFLHAHDEPAHSMSALAGYALAEATHRHGIKVAISGQGADETLAGYGSYFLIYWQELVRTGHLARALAECERFARAHRGAARKQVWQLLEWLLKQPARIFPGYATLARRRRNARLDRRRWLDPEFTRFASPQDAGSRSLSDALADSVTRAPLPLYLRVEDRNAMAFSVEERLPFLDPDLVSFVSRLPACWKLRGAYSKWVLRAAMTGLIPEAVRMRIEKMGFPTPVERWMRGPLYERVRDVLASRAFRERGIYNHAAILRDAELFRRGEIRKLGAPLFDVVQLEQWHATVMAPQGDVRPVRPLTTLAGKE